MKYIISLLFIHLMCFHCVAQTINFNQGETTQKDYFSIVKFENIGGFLIVKATIRGETYRFLLDTGAPNAISKALYEKLKPTILSDEKIMDSNGVLNGTKMVNVEELTLGNIVFNNIPTAVFEDFMLLECLQIDGFIGSNMLRNSIIQISYADETLFLTDDTTRLNLSENHATNMAFFDEQSSPYVEIRLRGEIEGSDWVQFDTGFKGFYSITSIGYDSVLSKYPILKLENTGYGGNSMGLWGFNEAKCYKLKAPELILNSALFLNVSTESSSDNTSRIGLDILKYGKVTVDYRHQKFYFEPYNAHVDLSKKEFPISPKFEGNKLLIGTIWGKKYGKLINIGDQILSIDGVNYEKTDPCDMILYGSLLENKDSAQLLIKTKTGKIVTIFMERE